MPRLFSKSITTLQSWRMLSKLLCGKTVKSYAPAIAAMHCRETGKDTEKFALKVTVY